MSETTDPFESLTEDELAELSKDSEQLPGEDSSSWASRAKNLAEGAKDRAAKRRAEEAAPIEADPEA